VAATVTFTTEGRDDLGRRTWEFAIGGTNVARADNVAVVIQNPPRTCYCSFLDVTLATGGTGTTLQPQFQRTAGAVVVAAQAAYIGQVDTAAMHIITQDPLVITGLPTLGTVYFAPLVDAGANNTISGTMILTEGVPL